MISVATRLMKADQAEPEQCNPIPALSHGRALLWGQTRTDLFVDSYRAMGSFVWVPLCIHTKQLLQWFGSTGTPTPPSAVTLAWAQPFPSETPWLLLPPHDTSLNSAPRVRCRTIMALHLCQDIPSAPVSFTQLFCQVWRVVT